MPLQRQAGSGDLLEATIAAIWQSDADSDSEKVQALFDEWQSGGLGVAGPEATLTAFERGQVEELIITGSVETLKPVQKLPDNAATGMAEDTSAPQAVGGVGALLRFRL